MRHAALWGVMAVGGFACGGRLDETTEAPQRPPPAVADPENKPPPMQARPVVQNRFAVETVAETEPVYVMASDGVHLYLGAGGGRVLRMSLAPPHVNELLDDDETHQSTSGIAVDQTHVYWTIHSWGVIKRKSKAGGDAELLSRNECGPAGIVLDDQHVYWACSFVPEAGGGVFRMTKAGGAATRTALVQNGWPFGVWRFDEGIFVSGGSRLLRVGNAGLVPFTDGLGEEGMGCTIAPYGERLAFACWRPFRPTSPTISSMPLAGGPASVLAIGAAPVERIWPIRGGLLYATREGTSDTYADAQIRLFAHRWSDTVDVELARWRYGAGQGWPNLGALVVEGERVHYIEFEVAARKPWQVRAITLP